MYFEISQEFLEKLDKDRRTPVHEFAKRNDSDTMEDIFQTIPSEHWIGLLSAQDRDGNTPLHEAVRGNEKAWLKTVMHWITDEEKLTLFKCENSKKETPLRISLAVQSGFTEISELLECLNADERRQLLSMQEKFGRTALHLAVAEGQRNSIGNLSCLLRSLDYHNSQPTEGWKVEILNIADVNGQTVLHVISAEVMIRVPLLKAYL